MPRYWIVVFAVVFIWSASAPYSVLNWTLEMFPASLACGVLYATRQRFPLTPLSYAALLILCLLILVGAHYGFGRVPLFEWLRQAWSGERNNFDKLAHLFQGFTPALVFRECLIRWRVVTDRRWLWGLVPALALALSAGYELVEWWAALMLRADRAEDFLAIQGDPWDAQSDMACALLGAVIAQGLFSRRHDRQLARLG